MKYATQTKHGDASRTHGKTRLWNIWAGMRNRCNRINDEFYGGRGISVCDEWQDYQSFKDWALNNGYSDDLTIDRKNVNGNYCPENCRWADSKTQARNKTNSVYVKFNGEIHTIARWGEISGIKANTLSRRYQYGYVESGKFLDPLIEPIARNYSNKKRVQQIDRNSNEIIKVWDCISEVQRELGIKHSGISNCCRGKKKTAGGYVWRYDENERSAIQA